GGAGHAGQLFDPVPGHQAGVVAGAAGDDVHRPGFRQQALGVHAEDLGEDAAAGDATLERVGDGLRLLVDLLEHVVRVIALVDGVGAEVRFAHLALHGPAVGVEDLEAVAADADDV